jgi:hypothetical protein
MIKERWVRVSYIGERYDSNKHQDMIQEAEGASAWLRRNNYVPIQMDLLKDIMKVMEGSAVPNGHLQACTTIIMNGYIESHNKWMEDKNE